MCYTNTSELNILGQVEDAGPIPARTISRYPSPSPFSPPQVLSAFISLSLSSHLSSPPSALPSRFLSVCFLSSVPFPILVRCRRHRRNLISTISAPSHTEAQTVKNAHTDSLPYFSTPPSLPSLFLTLLKNTCTVGKVT